MKLLLYCTKAKPYLYDLRKLMGEFSQYNAKQINFDDFLINGKTVAECDFEVEDLRIVDDDPLGAYWYETKTLSENEVLEKSCLTSDELYEYLGEYNEGYAIHIKNLHIFDKPRELSDYKGNSKGNFFKIIEKAPQNMQMVLNEKLEDCILISIRPKWLCKILNGEKTIECRKKVLKEMLKND